MNVTVGIQDLRQWVGASVVDRGGDKIGSLEAIYVDPATDQPVFGAVKTGLPGFQKKVLVPLDGSAVGRTDLRVAYDKEVVKGSPSFPTDAEVDAADEPAIFGHYQLPVTPTTTPGGRRLARH